MTEIKISHGTWTNAPYEMVDSRRLTIIGFISLAYGDQNYPMPLLTFPGQKKVTYNREFNRTRVEGLVPAHDDTTNTRFQQGSWTGQVDIDGNRPQGRGSVYLGSAISPSDTEGFILERPVPFDPEKELAFVRVFDESVVIAGMERFIEGRYLAYATPRITEILDKYVIPRR